MDQSDLRRLEAQCIQEEPPRCQAACPLHVDARGVCAHLAQGKTDPAWALICRTLPLPGVMARICDAPCKAACLRSETGGAVEMAALERFCAENATRTPPLRPLPGRGKTAAVLGAGLAGLTAAWDLAKKGYGVTVFCEEPGRDLRALPDMPGEALDKELAALEKLGAKLRTGKAPGAQSLADAIQAHDAVFADLDDCPDLGPMDSDAMTLGTDTPGLFAAAQPGGEGFCASARAALGRRAANSIERFTQGASLTAGREREGAYETRLFTSLEDTISTAPAAVPDAGYDADQARAEAARCLQCECMECVKSCEYLAHYKGYPKTYARQIYNNESIVMGTRHANEMINSCMLCGQCEQICPEDFDMAALCLDIRRSMVAKGKMPPSAHEFALRDMAFADSEACAVARHAPGHGSSSLLFFPGCQLSASDPGALERAYALLRQLRGDVGLLLRCCGAPAHWAGREELFALSMEALRGQWKDLGAPPVAVACPTCAATLREHLPEAEVVSLWTLLRDEATEDGALVTGEAPAQSGDVPAAAPLAVHDPCAARHDAVQRADVRALLAAMGVETVEPPMTGERTPCCGFGGLAADANPSLAAKAARRRAAQVDEDYVTYCAMCRDMLARAGKPARHVLDLLLPPDGGAQRARPAPGHSARRENRAALKERLLTGLWKEDGAPPPAHQAVNVEFTDKAARVMEERRILVSDVQKTLLAAPAGGKVLRNTDTGRLLATHRPVSVTYWVEYEPHGGGFLVHNAWCHRMRVLGGPA